MYMDFFCIHLCFLFVDDQDSCHFHSVVPGEGTQHEFSEHCWSEEEGLYACLAGQEV